MNKYIVFIVMALLYMPVSSADISNGCDAVLQHGVRDYNFETTDIGVAVKVYDEYCENGSIKSGKSLDAGLDAVIEAVPVKFNLGSGSTEKRTKHFCKTFDSDYKSNEKYYRETSKVVHEAINAWSQCMTLASQGVIFRPQISKTQVLIEIARRLADNIVVQGIQYEQDVLTCTVPNSDTNNKPVKATLNTVKTLDPGSWTVTCIRTPKITSEGAAYDETDISIGTNKGPFLLKVPKDGKLTPQWASEIQKKIIESDNDMYARINAINSNLNNIWIFKFVGPKENSGPIKAKYCSLASIDSKIADATSGSGCFLSYNSETKIWLLSAQQDNKHMKMSCQMVCFGVET